MQELLLVGQKMSNVLFNLAQDERFAEYSEMMKGLQREWDAAQHRVHPTGGTHSQIVSMVNSLGNIVIDAASKGYVSSNDLDYANDCLDKVIPLLKPTSG